MTRSGLLPTTLLLLCACHDEPSHVVVTEPLTLRPFAVAVSRLGVAYVGRASADVVARANLPATTFSASVAVRREPTSVAFDATGARAYVTNQFAQQVSIIDVATNAQIDSIVVIGDPFIVKVSPDNQTVWVSTNVNSLYGFDRNTKSMVGDFAMPMVPNSIAFSPANDSLLYVSTLTDGRVVEINYKRMTVGRTFTPGGLLQGIVVSPDGNRLYVADQVNHRLHIVDLAGGTLLAPLDLPGAPFDVQITPNGRQLWISFPVSGSIRVIDRATGAIVETFSTGGAPRRMAFNSDGTILVAANEAGWVDFVK